MIELKDLLAALGGGGLAGVSLKLIDIWKDSKNKQLGSEEAFRKDLHLEIQSVRQELKHIQVEGIQWRDRYFSCIEEKGIVKIKQEDLQKELDRLRKDFEELKLETEENIQLNNLLKKKLLQYSLLHQKFKNEKCVDLGCPIAKDLEDLPFNPQILGIKEDNKGK